MARSKPEAATGASNLSSDNRLDSWKEIAAHLKQDERTVRRWEKAEGLPIHRHVHKRQATVYAYKSELNEWWDNRRPGLELQEQVQGAVRGRWRVLLLALLAVSLLVLGAVKLRDWRLRARGSDDSYEIRSVAVLPLENLSTDPEQEYFADGITEDLIANLAQISALRVISRTSVMQYKHAKKPLPQIARALNVDAVVEGVIERSGDQVRITAQLIYAPADRHLWAKSYERQLRDILVLQDEVARDIAEEVRAKLTPHEKVQLAGARAVNPAAYDAYLKARFFMKEGYAEGMQKGLESLRKALEIDPSFALAYAGLAQAYTALGNTSVLSTKETYPKAKAAALRALEIDDSLAEAHLAVATVDHLYGWDQSSAKHEYQRAFALNPSLAGAHGGYSLYLIHMLRCEEAAAEARTVTQLDPASLDGSRLLGIAYWCGHHWDRALEQFQSVLERNPNEYYSLYWSAEAYIAKGEYQEAIAEAKRMETGGSLPETLARFLAGVAYAGSGRRAQAVNIIEGLKQSRMKGHARPVMIAGIYAKLGEKEQAINWLEKACEEHDDWVVWNRVHPNFQILHSDPRFQGLMRRVGLLP